MADQPFEPFDLAARAVRAGVPLGEAKKLLCAVLLNGENVPEECADEYCRIPVSSDGDYCDFHGQLKAQEERNVAQERERMRAWTIRALKERAHEPGVVDKVLKLGQKKEQHDRHITVARLIDFGAKPGTGQVHEIFQALVQLGVVDKADGEWYVKRGASRNPLETADAQGQDSLTANVDTFLDKMLGRTTA